MNKAVTMCPPVDCDDMCCKRHGRLSYLVWLQSMVRYPLQACRQSFWTYVDIVPELYGQAPHCSAPAAMNNQTIHTSPSKVQSLTDQLLEAGVQHHPPAAFGSCTQLFTTVPFQVRGSWHCDSCSTSHHLQLCVSQESSRQTLASCHAHAHSTWQPAPE